MKLKYGAATGFADPRIWAILSAQPAYQTQRSIARPTAVRAAGIARPSAAATSAVNWSKRPSMSSATRYRICPRFIAVREAQPPAAPRDERTASRTSLRDARHALARGDPSEPATRYDRPLSVRGNWPPRYSL